MKKIALAILAMGLLVTGFWWTIRRRPSTIPPGDTTQTLFRIETAQRGSLIRYDDPQTPLRSLRWLPPLPGGMFIVQVVTQNDRQQISLFKDGAFQASYLVPKPLGVREGFFRIAELRDARVVDGDVAVLLYAAPGSDELPLLMALDLKTQDIRWMHRAPGERLVMTEGPEGILYLFGPKTPPVRLPLVSSSGERTSPAGARSAARVIELPPEILEIADLKPTGTWTFLLAHKGGLATYLGSKGWEHHPLPDGDPGLFPEPRATLCSGGKKYWWQPFPGRVIQVLADGTPKADWTAEALLAAEPFAKDSALLRLLGADGEGKLWFDLAVPASTPGPETGWKPEEPAESAAPPAKLEDWAAYLSQGLDRLYCWDLQKKRLQRYQWTALTVPPGFSKPMNGTPLQPASGFLMLESGPSAWLVPLSTLDFGEPAATGQPK